MAQWQAPSTHNERPVEDIGLAEYGTARPYLDVDGRVKWWSGAGDLPAGLTPLYIVIRASDSRRVFSTDVANEVRPALFGSYVLIR